MKEKPILFSAPMVRAILEGRKTQTRRVLRSQRSPYGKPGDRLWVREAWQYYDWTEEGEPYIRFEADKQVKRRKDSEEWADRLGEIWAELSAPENYIINNRACDQKWRPSIHMPRWASRIDLEITDIRVERLQDISEEDAKAEGALRMVMDDESKFYESEKGTFKTGFAGLWEHINGNWDANPWVWRLEFQRHKAAKEAQAA